MTKDQATAILGMLDDYKHDKIEAISILNYIILIVERKWESKSSTSLDWRSSQES